MRFTFPVHRSAVDLTYKVQISPDLTHWTTTALYNSSWAESRAINSKGNEVIEEIVYDLTRTALDPATESLSIEDQGSTSWSRFWKVTEVLADGLMTPTGHYYVQVLAERGSP
jgi:hypothetical protein